MAYHPPRTWLTGFLQGRLSAKPTRTVVIHLIQGCTRCRERMALLVDTIFRPGRASGPPEDESRYEAALNRAYEHVLELKRRREEERQEADLKIARLLCAPSLPERADFWTWGLCEVLLERSWSLRHEDPDGMLRLATLACEAADHLEPAVYGEKETLDLRARAWGEFANACRVGDDLPKAEWAMGRALELLNSGTRAPLLRARLAELTASLLSHQRRFPAAFQALDLARALYEKHGDCHDAVRVLVQRAIYTGRSGDPEMGVRLLAKALQLIDRDRDPKLVFIILHNMLLFRAENGEYREANIQLFEMRPLYAHYAGAVDMGKLRWIEGKIAAGLGELDRAERSFLYVREEFQRRGQVYHAAVFSLDLAAIWLQQGRTAEVKSLVKEMLETFRAEYVARETIAALLMLREALDQDRATLDLLTIVTGVIRQHQDEAS